MNRTPSRPLPRRPACLAFLCARRVSSRSWMMTCRTRRKKRCVEVLEVRTDMEGSCSSRPPSARFCEATITTLSAVSNLWWKVGEGLGVNVIGRDKG